MRIYHDWENKWATILPTAEKTNNWYDDRIGLSFPLSRTEDTWNHIKVSVGGMEMELYHGHYEIVDGKTIGKSWHNEKRIPDGTKVCEKETGAILTIYTAIETNNQFGYGVYLYRFKEHMGTSFGLYRKHFEPLPDKDFYLEDSNVVDRLVREWNQYGKLIIAYDYDNTVYDYHGTGQTYNDVVRLLKECAEVGAFFTVFTACEEEKHPAIREYLTKEGIPFDCINDNPPFIDFSGRKIYYNILLDDRAGLSSAYHCLRAALRVMKGEGEYRAGQRVRIRDGNAYIGEEDTVVRRLAGSTLSYQLANHPGHWPHSSLTRME